MQQQSTRGKPGEARTSPTPCDRLAQEETQGGVRHQAGAASASPSAAAHRRRRVTATGETTGIGAQARRGVTATRRDSWDSPRQLEGRTRLTRLSRVKPSRSVSPRISSASASARTRSASACSPETLHTRTLARTCRHARCYATTGLCLATALRLSARTEFKS